MLFTLATLWLPGTCFADAAPVVVPAIVFAKTALFDLEDGVDKLVAVGELGVVMRSRDGGVTWSGSRSPATRTLTSVKFASAKLGIAVGHGGTILRTEDGGNTWRSIAVPESGSDALLGLTILEGNRVIAYGAFGLYLESADLGVTWTRKRIISESFDRHIAKVVALRDKFLLVGESGTLAVSHDRGRTWTSIPSPYVGSFFGALPLKNNGALIFGMRGRIYRSDNGAKTWNLIDIPSTSAINSGSVAADGRVVLVGNNGLIATSVDDGRNFTLHAAPQGLPLAQARYGDGNVLNYVGYLANGQFKLPAPNPAARNR